MLASLVATCKMDGVNPFNYMPLLRFEWVTLGKYGRHPTVRPGRPSLRPDHAV